MGGAACTHVTGEYAGWGGDSRAARIASAGAGDDPAIERRAAWLLIDERQGRLAAEGMGLSVIGSIGVLVAAKVRGDLTAIAPLLGALRESGLWMTEALVARVLAAVGEGSGG